MKENSTAFRMVWNDVKTVRDVDAGKQATKDEISKQKWIVGVAALFIPEYKIMQTSKLDLKYLRSENCDVTHELWKRIFFLELKGENPQRH